MRDSLLQWFAQRFLDRRLAPRELLTARKLVYIGLILVLFFGSFMWRRYSVEAQAASLAVLEQNRGDVELSGTLVRLTLTGLRGVATCVLWVEAIDAMKKNEWNKLEFYVGALTKLQPHFVTPWLFQSWNLAYNVSVEADRPFDKYFYIARGVQLLAEGERRNRDIPEMRFYNGFYTQHKICVSDETNVLRSLFQLSMIPPNERDPARFRKRDADGNEVFNWQELESFCKTHPKLVRRLAVGLRRDTKREQERQFTCVRAEDVVQFLSDNWRVPSIYAETSPTPSAGDWSRENDKKDVRAPLAQRFPTLPPQRDRVPPPQQVFRPADEFEEPLHDKAELDDSVDGQAVARAWYGYAQEPVPPPGKLPGSTQPPSDPRRQRKPKQMSTLIFRTYPALAQTHLCRDLQQEGWFDETPWEIPEWFKPVGNRFNNGAEVAAVKVAAKNTSQTQWQYCADMWYKVGTVNHLIFSDPTEETNLLALADRYWQREGQYRYADPLKLDDSALKPEERERLRPEEKRDLLVELARAKLSEAHKQEFDAALFLFELSLYRQISNFLHHYYVAQVEKESDTVVARKLFAEATMLRYQASFGSAIETYLKPEALAAWRDKVLAVGSIGTHAEYRNDNQIQEETFEAQLDYLLLLKDQYDGALKKRVADDFARYAGCAQALLAGGGGFMPVPLGLGLALANDRNRDAAFRGAEFFPRPFDLYVLESSSVVGQSANYDRLRNFLPAYLALNAGASSATFAGGMSQPAVAYSYLAGISRPLIPEGVAQAVLQRRNLVPVAQSGPAPVGPGSGGAGPQAEPVSGPMPQ